MDDPEENRNLAVEPDMEVIVTIFTTTIINFFLVNTTIIIVNNITITIFIIVTITQVLMEVFSARLRAGWRGEASE